MQTTSSGWGNKVSQGKRNIGYGVLISFLRTIASGIKFFTIGQSRIGGPDIIKSGGQFVSFFDKYRYDDYSPFIRSISVKRNIGQLPYGVIVSEADIELDNTSKKFLPNYDTTIGSGILPNRPIKISIGIEDEYMGLFTGYTEQPQPTLNDRHMDLHSFDVFNYFNSFTSTMSGVFVNAPFQNIVASGLYEMGFSSSQFILDKSLQQNIGYFAPYNKKWGDIFKDGTEAEQGLMFAGENGMIRFWNRQHFLTASGVPKFQLSYSKLSDITWQNTAVINYVKVTAKPLELKANDKIWESDTSIILEPNADTDYFIDFEDDTGPFTAVSLSTPKYIDSAAVNESSYQTNSSDDGSGNSNSSSVSLINAYNFGETYKLTFRNTSTARMYITKLVIFGQAAKIREVIQQEYKAQDSSDTYGTNPALQGEPLEIKNDLIQDKDTAYSIAYTLVQEYKNPGKRYICPVAVGADPALQIGDAGLIIINDTGEVKNVYITGITNTINRNGQYMQTLEVEERSIKRYFTINQSRVGGTDSIAP